MGVRLQGEYRSTGLGGDYTLVTVQIIDTASGDTQHPVTFTEGGVTFNLSGEQRSLHGRFASMTATFEIIMDHSEVDSFAAALASHDEERFFVKVGINGVVRFIGILTADGDQWEDLHRDASPTLRLIAMDGMGRMSGQNYADSEEDDAVYTGYELMHKIIWKCMKGCGTMAHFAGQPFFAILHDNTEDSQAVSGDPLNNQRVNQDIFFERALDTGTYNFKSKREVLQYICVAYNLCCKYIGPYYLFYNPALLPGSAYAYDVESTAAGTVSTGSTLTINDDKLLDANRAGISHFGVLPPLYRARITYDHGPQDVNMLFGVSYKGYNHFADPGPDGTMIECGPVTVLAAESVILRFSGKLRLNSKLYGGGSPPRWKNHRYHFRIKLMVEWSGNEMWWHRDYNNFDFYTTSFSNYTNPQWYQSGEEYYDWVSEIIDERNADINLFKMVGFDTQLLVSGAVNNVWFGFEVVRVFDEKENIINLGDNPDRCDWEFSDLELVALENGTILKRPTKTVSEGLGNPKNSDYLEETTLIGDGPMKSSNSRIQIYDGSEWKDSAEWGGIKLHRKSVKNIAEARTESLRLLLGGLYALNFWFDSVISYNGIDYFAMSLQYRTGSDYWSGEMVEIGSSGSGITTKEKRVLVKEKVPLPENPNKLPDDETKQDRILKEIISEAHIPGTTYNQLELRDQIKYDYQYRKGDILNIIDPIYGDVDEGLIIISEDAFEGDTVLNIEDWTPGSVFPPGSWVEIEKEYESASRLKIIYQRNNSFTGTAWNIFSDGEYEFPSALEGKLLPNEAVVTDQDYSALVRQLKAGQKLMYKINIDNGSEYHKGFYGVRATDTIHFYEPCTGQPVEIYIYYIPTI